MRLLAAILCLGASGVAALRSPVPFGDRGAPLAGKVEGQLSRMENVRGYWRSRNGKWRTADEVSSCVAGRRSYVKQGDFFDLQPRDPEQLLWTSSENLALVVAATYLLYAPCVYALALVPAPNEVEGGYFFSLVSIIFGTLTASTISDATQRLSSLRAAIVDECSLMLPLLERLTIVLHENDREGQDRERLFVACANQLWLHVTDIISGTREIELELMSSREYDPLISIVSALQRAQYRYETDELTFAIKATEDIVRARGYRLQLEGSGLPPLQYAVLRALSGLVVISYTYLTLDRPERLSMPTIVGFSLEHGHVLPDPSLGVHILFACICGTLVVFNSLAEDYNRPFQGVARMDSETVTASLRQLRNSLQPHCDIEGCAVAAEENLYL